MSRISRVAALLVVLFLWFLIWVWSPWSGYDPTVCDPDIEAAIEGIPSEEGVWSRNPVPPRVSMSPVANGCDYDLGVEPQAVFYVGAAHGSDWPLEEEDAETICAAHSSEWAYCGVQTGFNEHRWVAYEFVVEGSPDNRYVWRGSIPGNLGGGDHVVVSLEVVSEELFDGREYWGYFVYFSRVADWLDEH